MGAHEEIKKKIREMVGLPILPVIGTVVSVEGESCTIKCPSGLELPDVRLKASINNSSNFILYTPTLGCNIIAISLTGELNDLFVVKCDEWDSFEFVNNQFKVLLDATDSKVSIANESTSLFDLFKKNVDILNNMKVLTSNGPSNGIHPDVIAKILQFETAYKQLLK